MKATKQPDAEYEEPAPFGTVPLSKRVHNWIERTEAGIQIDILSSLLSVLTVFTYMVETALPDYHPVYQSLRQVDLVCSCLFVLEWLFWLWLAHDRWRYVFSSQSLLDLGTTIPLFVSFAMHRDVSTSAASVVESMVRILRVLRVFRIFRLGKRLQNEIQMRLLTLIFTLLAIIVTSAGLFYEIETRFGDRYPDLTIVQALYWSVVTTTTIGYGDITPSVMASQATLILALLLTFAILPYQTSMLVTALNETSPYQTARYSHTARGRHVVFTGQFSVPSMGLLVEELYSTQDYGFPDFNLVLLSPEAPSDELKRLLKTHKQSHRMLYLQGSCMNNADLARAQVQFADAVFIMADKSPQDARQQDLQNSMACLAVGHYCLQLQRTQARHGPRPLSEQLAQLVRDMEARLRPKKSSAGLPRVCIQLLLPESQLNLDSLLASSSGSSGVVSSSSFWQLFSSHVTVICLSEIKYSLMGQSCLACPGAVTLVNNLVHSVDSQALLHAQCEQVPLAVQEYLQGSTNELYEVASLPAHLIGEPVSLLAVYLHEVYQAVAIATAGGADAAEPESAIDPDIDTAQAASRGSSALSAGSVATAVSNAHSLVLAPLHQIVTPHTSAFVIASDLRVVLDIMDAPAEEYFTWKLAHTAAAGLDGATGGRRRQRTSRGAIQVNTRQRDFGDVALAAVQADLPELRRRLTSASRKGRALASKQLQLLYHTRSEAEADDSLEGFLQAEVQLQGHLLVCGNGAPPSALFCLLAPLRSSSLPVVQPVVVLDSSTPSGPEWQQIARLEKVYFVQGSMHDPEALLRANAESAAGAVLLLPWGCGGASWPHCPTGDAGMADAYVMAAARHLHSLNPHMQVLCELSQCSSLVFLDPLGSLLDWRCGEAAAAAATPAFMSGGVLLPQMLDSLTCQALYSCGTPRIISQLLTQWHSQPSGSGGGVLLQLPVAGFPCDTFGQLFAWLVGCGMVCCGLYRCAEVAELGGREICYVYTNPDGDTQLHATDQAYVLVPHRSNCQAGGAGGKPTGSNTPIAEPTGSSFC
ncbi:hypothetical protein OEZ85_011123 [Tetradesmus obliquus]|uniref:Ion transport domain-containing protein n=1 Tax=Tetradesmus obliquus TaxID=3088 RepID=A0ABY8TPA7_TETOB|nr:hypothetical protein OEZ85_011123 [Tetradesmus obliquus]